MIPKRRNIFKYATVATPWGMAPMDVIVEGEQIIWVGFDADPSPTDNVYELNGLLLLPGFVDMHTHLHLQVGNFLVADDFASGTQAALVGGTTTVVEYVTPEPGEDFELAMLQWREKAASSFIDYAFHLCVPSVTPEILDELPRFVEKGITGFKVFLAYPERLQLSLDNIGRVMEIVGPAGGVVFVHAEEGDEIERLRKEAVAAGRLCPAEHARTRPPSTEEKAVAQIIDLVRKTHCPTVIVHVSTANAVELLTQARIEGLPVFGETCPHYLWFTDKMLERPFPESAHYVCSPPLRTMTDASSLWDALTVGALQFLATDHCPFSSNVRCAVEDFSRIPNGMSAIGSRFFMTFAGGPRSGRFGMERLTHVLSTFPAMICGLYPRKGAIVPGADADLVIVDPFGVTDLDTDPLAGAVDFNPWAGIFAPGSILGVMGRGKWLWKEGLMAVDSPQGIFIERKRLRKHSIEQLLRKDLAWILSH